MSDQLHPASAPRDAQFQRVEVIPSAGLIGADIRIPDVRLLDAAAAQELRQAWLKYEVVRIRGQQLE